MSCLQFQDLNVNVDSPQKHLDPLETYISFRVTTKVKQDVCDDIEYIVRRRYNDFIWLRNKLVEAFPTLLVPALPGKHSVIGQLDRYSKQFIMFRMALLHSYLQRLATHPVFSSSPVLKIFLTAKPAEFSMHSKDGSGILVRLTDSLQNLAGCLPRHEPVHSEFNLVRQYVNSLSQKLTLIHSVAMRINKERIELSSDLEDAKKSLHIWSKHEPDLRAIINAIFEAVANVASFQNTYLIQNFVKQLQQPLEEYLIYTDAVKEALIRRDSIQIAFESKREETNRKKAEKDQENYDKMEIANESMRADLERWNIEKRSEIKVILNNMAEQHITFYKQSLHEWEKALAALQTKNLNEILH